MTIDSQKLHELYENLRDQWADETLFMSYIDINNEKFKKLLDLGQGILPFLFEDLENNDYSVGYFLILHRLLEHDAAVGHTTVEGARKAWIEYAKNHNYLK